MSALSIIIITPVLLQSLGKEDFGWYGSLLNLITISAAVDLGMNVGLLRRIIHEPNRSKTLINTPTNLKIKKILQLVVDPIYFHLVVSHFILVQLSVVF